MISENRAGGPAADRGSIHNRDFYNIYSLFNTKLRIRKNKNTYTTGALRIFPSFSWHGKCDSSGGKPPTLTLQQAAACLLSVLSCESPYGSSDRKARTKVLWLSHGTFHEIRDFGTSLQPERVGALKVRYPNELVNCGRFHARVPRLQPERNSPLRFSKRSAYGSPGKKATFDGDCSCECT